MKINTIKGIDRIGIILGIIAGIFMGIETYPLFYDWLKKDNPWHTEWRNELKETREKLKTEWKEKNPPDRFDPKREESLRQLELEERWRQLGLLKGKLGDMYPRLSLSLRAIAREEIAREREEEYIKKGLADIYKIEPDRYVYPSKVATLLLAILVGTVSFIAIAGIISGCSRLVKFVSLWIYRGFRYEDKKKDQDELDSK